MKIHVYVNTEKFELEDPYAIQEPLVNQSWYFQIEGKRKRYTVVRVDNIFVVSGKSLDVIKEVTLEE